MGGDYLIPANSKKSKLILGFFNPIDLIIFITGVVLTVVLLISLKSTSLWVTLLKLAPLLISAFLVMPVPNYHNTFTLINNIMQYFRSPKEYKWKGWCYKDDKSS